MTGSGLDAWIGRQLAASAERLPACVSASGLARPGPRLGQTMRPAPGSILAAPQPEPGPGEPDYFFHWFRDAALAVGGLLALGRLGRLTAGAAAKLADYLGFELGLQRLDGRRLLDGWPPPLLPALAPYLRPAAELAAAHGPAVLAESRVAPDGSLDLLRWGRPQYDGPALRALALLELLDAELLPAPAERGRAARLLRGDLRFCLAHCDRPGFDPWEEERGRHFHPRLVQRAALSRGADWLAAGGEAGLAGPCAAAAEALTGALEAHWSAADGLYRSRLPGPGIDEAKRLDSSVLLAVLHAGPAEGPGNLHDPRVEATVGRLEAFFAAELPVNAGRAPGDGLLLGRYPGDAYLGGGAFLPCCFGLAEYRYRRGERRLGDAVLARLAALLPEPGPLPEQLDRASGAPRSARDLAWSHAAFATAAAARATLG